MRAPVGPLSLSLLLASACVDANLTNSVVVTTTPVDDGSTSSDAGDEPAPTTGDAADDTTTGADVSTGAADDSTTGDQPMDESTRFDLGGVPDPIDPVDDTSTGDEGTSTGSSTGDESSTTTGAGACVPVKVEPVRPAVAVVLAKGSLMKTTKWDPDGLVATFGLATHWESANKALDALLAAHESRLDFGLSLYPRMGAQYTAAKQCLMSDTIEVATGPQTRSIILKKLSVINSLSAINGGQPMTAGLVAAYDDLRGVPPGVPRTVILIANAAANCGADVSYTKQPETYDDTVHGVVVDALAADGITTHVAGMALLDVDFGSWADLRPDGINPHQVLQQLAGEGGGSYTNAATEPELLAVLDGIAGGLTSCTLPKLDVDLEQVSIEIAGAKLLHLAGCDGTSSGWTVVDGAVQMCGDACAALKVVGSVDVFVGCDA